MGKGNEQRENGGRKTDEIKTEANRVKGRKGGK
jgi:hypothetical protein